MNVGWNRGIVLLLIAGTYLALPACESGPGTTEFKHKDPVTGETEWKRTITGPDTSLPSGWTPQGEQVITITINGVTFQIHICIAQNPDSPGCVYMNLGGCSSTNGWTLHCPSTVVTPGGTPPGGGAGAPGSGGTPVIEVPPEPAWPGCPSEWGTVSYDQVNETTSLSFTTACGDEPVPSGLVGVTITSPSGITLPADDFAAAYDGAIPQGSTVHVTGSDEVVAWACWKFGRTRLKFTTTDGHTVNGAVVKVPNAPPIAFVAVDGVIVRTCVVSLP